MRGVMVLSGRLSRHTALWGRGIDSRLQRAAARGAALARAEAAQAGLSSQLISPEQDPISRANESAAPGGQHHNHCLRLRPAGPSEESEQCRSFMDDTEHLDASVDNSFCVYQTDGSM